MKEKKCSIQCKHFKRCKIHQPNKCGDKFDIRKPIKRIQDKKDPWKIGK